MKRYENDDPLSIGGWIGTLLVLMIPVVNLVMFFVWAFGNGNECRKNFALASLILTLLGAALVIAMVVLQSTLILQIINEIRNMIAFR